MGGLYGWQEDRHHAFSAQPLEAMTRGRGEVLPRLVTGEGRGSCRDWLRRSSARASIAHRDRGKSYFGRATLSITSF